MKQTDGQKPVEVHEPIFNFEDEVWKPIVGYEGLYEASNLGRIRSIGIRAGKHGDVVILKQHNIKGYLRITLHKDKETKCFLSHRLIYEAFYGKLPKFERKGKTHGDEMWEINHKDEDKKNNKIENLELITKSQNIRYGTRSRRQAKKLTKSVYQYTLDRNLVKFWEGGAPEIFKHGYNKSCISECCRGVQKYYKGFLWSYVPL